MKSEVGQCPSSVFVEVGFRSISEQFRRRLSHAQSFWTLKFPVELAMQTSVALVLFVISAIRGKFVDCILIQINTCEITKAWLAKLQNTRNLFASR